MTETKYMNELANLEDIINFIEPENEINNNLEQLMESCFELIEHYIITNPTAISEPDFEEDLIDELEEIMVEYLDNNVTDKEMEELEEIVEYAVEHYFKWAYPPRSYEDSIILAWPDIETIQPKLDYLISKPQPAQRTIEWYQTRHNLLTASNAYKAFESQTVQNQLIYEKCQPLITKERLESATPQQVNVNTTLHWGQKYEPLSVLIYEDMYNTKVGDFGCIPHDTYKFIGASPDGINIDQTSPRFGRMLEIKNIVNREIDGIPKKEYWIQMQMQMETCDLEECDFLETKFEEYQTSEEFLNDGQFAITQKNQRKGVIMYFSKNDGNPKYIYMSLSIQTWDEFEVWEAKTIEENPDLSWISNYYWKLEIISCVLVPRNKQWFESNVHQLIAIWDTILEERCTGYEHRAPQKRVVKPKIEQSTTQESITDLQINECLIVIKKI
jgi:putative phage-type endonuclease